MGATLIIALHVVAIPGQSPPQGRLPLQPTRTIRFTTSEGSWMSLDVSPDGRTIVFDLLGHLYSIPISGGRATRITSGMAFDAQPRFSPNGRMIAFTSDRDGWTNVWVAARDGTGARQITHWREPEGRPWVMSPEWAPDGSRVVVSERVGGLLGGMQLAEYAVSGVERITMTHVGGGAEGDKDKSEFRGAAFGRDARFVYAAMRRGSDGEGQWQVVRIDRAAHTWRLETSATTGMSAFSPVLSPDGHYLAFSAPSGDGSGIRIRDLRSDRERWLVRPKRGQRNVVTWSFDSRDLSPGFSFTPDSRSLVASYEGKIWRIDVETGNEAGIPFTVDVEQPVGPLLRFSYPISDEPFLAHAIRTPEISPDGSRVVFTALDRLWVMELQDSTLRPRRLTTNEVGEFFPAWSPDGRYVAYANWSDSLGGALYRVRADSAGPPERLTSDTAFYTKPTYTTDGNEIVAVRGTMRGFRISASTWDRGPVGSMELIRLPASGGMSQSVGPYGLSALETWYWKNPAYVYGRPQARRDSDQISVYDRDEGVLSVGLDGSARHTVIRKVTYQARGTEALMAADVLLSPSGRYALALEWQTMRPYLIELPSALQGAGAPIIALGDTAAGGNPAGTRVHLLAPTGADFIGWTRDDRPYFNAGSALFIGQPAVAGTTPTFRRVDIHLAVRPDRPAGILLLKGARLITMRGHEVIENGDVLVVNGRIAGIGKSGSLRVPANTKVMNVSGATILPGYVDVHDHVGFSVAFGTHASQEPRLMTDLAYGITTLRDALGYGPDLMAYGERAVTGDLLSPRIFTMSYGVSPTLLYDQDTLSIGRARAVLALWSQYYRSETIKLHADGGRRMRQLIAIGANEQRLTPTTHRSSTAMALTTAIDGYGAVEHPLSVIPQFDDIVQLFARTGIIQTPTLGVYLLYRPLLWREDVWSDPKMRHFYPPTGRRIGTDFAGPPDDEATVREMTVPFARIMNAGGCVAMGSHGEIPGIGAHYEIELLTKGGMSNYDALRAATVCSARAIGHERDFGSLEVGKLADLQVLDKNPLDRIGNTRTIRYVMKDGRLYEARTLNEVWPRQRVLERQWWWGATAPQH